MGSNKEDGGMTDKATLGQLRVPDASFTGEVVRPGDPGYEDVRRVHNASIDKRPALILRCRSTADVVAALAVGRESGLEVAVRGGGHSIAGRSTTDGGVLIDLSPMKGIVVNPTTRTVRVQGGATWRELNREAAVHDLATTGGVISSTGVAGLTLGGGLGWLMGTHGLSVDNLMAVELVTAEGEVLDVTEATQPDLFWGLRGGGGNFGIAASLEFRLHPLGTVTAGLIAHPFEAARDLLAYVREYTVGAPDELAVMPLLVHAPDGSGTRLAAVAVCHAGSPEQAETDLAPLLGFGSPVLAQVGPMPYPAVNAMLDDGFPRGARYYWKSGFVAALGDGVIDALVEGFAACPSAMTGIAIEHFHGAVTRVPVDATAVPHREASFNVLIAGVWNDPAGDEANAAWARATYEALAPFLVGRRYVNYLSADDSAATPDAYGGNLTRLAELKRRYDPDNVFRLNQNISRA
jgi:FAD/FMN-containing dehydrogenase